MSQADCQLIDDLDAVLVTLGTPYGSRLCWCEKRIDNPMVRDHSASCEAAWEVHRRAQGEI